MVGVGCPTGARAGREGGGFFWCGGGRDEVITRGGSGGGPAEIEDCLMKHPAVGVAAVIGRPDELRTQIVKAFIVPNPGVTPTRELGDEIKEFVKVRLAAHEYPREIEFVEALPLTATGKIMRRELRDREAQGRAGEQT